MSPSAQRSFAKSFEGALIERASRSLRCAGRKPCSIREDAAAQSRRSVILADANIWIDFFRLRKPGLRKLLENNQVVMHPHLVAELALGSLHDRTQTLAKLDHMPQLRAVDLRDVRCMIETRGSLPSGHWAYRCSPDRILPCKPGNAAVDIRHAPRQGSKFARHPRESTLSYANRLAAMIGPVAVEQSPEPRVISA